MKRTTIILLLLTALLQGGLAQTTGNGEAPRNSLDNIIIRSAIKQSLFPEERVYLHFDNTAYYLGENIWFKAYVMSGVDEEPTTMSRVLYVELVSPEGYVVKTNKYRIESDGSCHGSFELNPLLLSGYYEVRAYTRYMLNRGKDAIFSRVFPIFDKVNADNWDFKNMLDRRRAFLVDIEENDSLTGLDRKIEWVNSELPSCDLRFYPEGGHLVNGIESTVAYEVFGNDGINSEQSITITADGKPLLTSTPEHLGKGTFTITPHKDIKYRAILKQGKKEKKFDLPDVEDEGATINVIEENGTYYITTRNNLDGATEMGCAVVHRGKVSFYERFQSTDTCMLFAIDSNTLAEGVNRVVLFVNESIPLAERLFFVTHTKPQESDNATAKLLVTSDGESIEELDVTPHGKITLDIEREDGKPITGGTFSLSVSDADYRQQTSYTYNLYTYMLLGSELKGYIPDAARYFDLKNNNRARELDLIMLTHGWTSYDWSKLCSRDAKLKHPIERGITIKGRFIKKRPDKRFGKLDRTIVTNKPGANIKFDITYNDSLLTKYNFNTDANGEFRIQTRDFTGKRVARLIGPRTSYDSRDSIFAFALDRYFSPAMRLYHYWERNTGMPTTQERLTAERDSIIKVHPFEYLISQVEVVSKKKREANYRPPRSEMRLDFLDEWEYAQDVTYLCNEKSTYYGGNEWQYDFAGTNGFTNYAPTVTIGGAETLSTLDRAVMAGGGIYNSSFSGYHRDMNSGFGIDNDGRFRINDPAFHNTLTAADILRSAFWRHNLDWCYWIQSMVIDGEYSSLSTPTPDKEYLEGVEPRKMMNFKEIVIRSDENTRKQFGGGTRILKATHKNKGNIDYRSYYEGFYGQMGINSRNNSLDDAPDVVASPEYGSSYIQENFVASTSLEVKRTMVIAEPTKRIAHNAIPNYVACFIPNTPEDEQKGLIPEYTQRGTTRYTMVYGYTQSKQFYSPDYSRIKPDATTADYRRTLLWSPNITAKNGRLSVELYNSTSAKRIAVDVEGYAGGTFYSSNDIATRGADKEDAGIDNLTMRETPIVGIHNIDILAFCFKKTEEGRSFFKHHMYDEAFTCFNEASALGYPDAIYNSAVCYMNGYGVECDTIEGFRRFRRAANIGHDKALYNLATCYLTGIGTAKNDSLAFICYDRAGEAGYAKALSTVADCYLIGRGTRQDSTMAYEYYSRAAAKNEPRALYIIGEKVAQTDSLLQLSKKQLRKQSTIGYYQKAAKLGNTDAQYRLAQFYEDGYYVKKSKKRAFNWYLHAAYNGHPEAAEKVAHMYEKGKGTKRDDKKAAAWYRVALEHGSQTAKEKVEWYDMFRFFSE
ncbi:MAG: SEL1-like repeat protein [Bacteroidaceae bacterium]|nr:SEL1-like repeat protein [Bacteroidaceae bacterium]